MDATAGDLHKPNAYIDAVLNAVQAAPGPRGGIR